MITEFQKNERNINNENRKRILVIQLESIMEIVMSTPLIQSIKNNSANHFIEILIMEEFKDAIIDAEFVDMIHTISYSVFDKMNEILVERRDEIYNENFIFNFVNGLGDFDEIYNLSHDNFSCWLNDNLYSSMRKKGGCILQTGEWLYSDIWQSYFISMNEFRNVNRFNLTDIYRGMVEKRVDKHYSLYVSYKEEDEISHERQCIAISIPYNIGREKRYLAFFAELCIALYEMGFQPVLVGDSFNNKEYERIELLSKKRVKNMSGENDFSKIAGVLKKCVLAISGNVIVSQLAAAVEIPVISVFEIGTFFWELAPWFDKSTVVLLDLEKLLPIEKFILFPEYRLGMITKEMLVKESESFGAVAYDSFFTNSELDGFGSLAFECINKKRMDAEHLYFELLKLSISNAFLNTEVVKPEEVRNYVEQMVQADIVGIEKSIEELEEYYIKMKWMEMNYQKLFTLIKKGKKLTKTLEVPEMTMGRESVSKRIEELQEEIYNEENKLKTEATENQFLKPIVSSMYMNASMLLSEGEENVIEIHKIYGLYIRVIENQIEFLKLMQNR